MWKCVGRVERVHQDLGLDPTARLPRAYPDGTVSATSVGVAQPPQRHKAVQTLCICYLQIAGCQGACFCTLKICISHVPVDSVFFIFYHRMTLEIDNLAPNLNFTTF